MRRIVRDKVLAALDRQQAELEPYIAEHLNYPDAFPLALAEPTVSLREIGSLKIVPRFGGDFPQVDITTVLHVAVVATATRREAARGVRTAAVPDACSGGGCSAWTSS